MGSEELRDKARDGGDNIKMGMKRNGFEFVD